MSARAARKLGKRDRGKLLDGHRGDAHAADGGIGGERRLDVEARRAERRRVARIGAGHRRGEQRRVLHRMRERPDRIERRRQRHRAVEADEAVGRLEAGQAAQRGGNADRAAGVGADRRRHQARRRRRRRSRCSTRPPRDASSCPTDSTARPSAGCGPSRRTRTRPCASCRAESCRRPAAARPPWRCDRRCVRASSSIRPSSAVPACASRSLSAMGRPCSGPRTPARASLGVGVAARASAHRRDRRR